MDICKLGSPIGEPKNWLWCTIDSKQGFNSKLLVSNAECIILECGSLFGESYNLSKCDWRLPSLVIIVVSIEAFHGNIV